MKVYIKDYQAAKKANEKELEGRRNWGCRKEIDTDDLYLDENGVIREKEEDNNPSFLSGLGW